MLTAKKLRLLSPLLLLTLVLLVLAACQAQHTMASGGPIAGTTLLTYNGHSNSVNSVRWSSDSKYIVSASSDGSIQKWDTSSGAKNWSTSIPNAATAVLSHKTNVVAVAVKGAQPSDSSKVILLDGYNGKQLSTFSYAACSVFDVVWSADDSTIAAACELGDVRIQKTNSATVVALHQRQGGLNALAWSPDGKRIALATYDSGHDLVRIFNVEDLKNIQEQPLFYAGNTATITSLAWSPDSKMIASASKNTIQIWDSWTLKTLFSYAKQTATITHLAYSHDGRQIVSASKDEAVHVFAANNGRTDLVYHGQSGSVQDAEWSVDDTRIASAHANATVKIWQAR